jgi:hypothetical protein
MLLENTPKAQSAMEYLMTYGWAILVIAIVLAALFSLGVFNGSNLTGTSCVASTGYLCQSPRLTSNGVLSLTFGQETGATIYDIELACTATAGSGGGPSNVLAWAVIETNTGNSYNSNVPVKNTKNGNSGKWSTNYGNALTLGSDQATSVSNLICYNGKGVPFGLQGGGQSAAIGTAFTGYLWLNYTTTRDEPPSASNPWHTVKAATITIKVV